MLISSSVIYVLFKFIAIKKFFNKNFDHVDILIKKREKIKLIKNITISLTRDIFID